MNPFTYRQVLEQYDRAQAAGEQRSLPEYSKYLNELYDTDAFSAGQHDGWWTRASTRADQFLESTIGQVTGDIGQGVGDVFGYGDIGRQVGQSFPRMALETAPLIAAEIGSAGAATPFIASAMLAGGAAATGGLMGAHTYAETQSPKAAAISGITGAIMPGMGRLGGAVAKRFLGAELARGLVTPLGEAATGISEGTPIAQRFATTPTQFLGEYLGSQLGMAGTQVASEKLQHPNEDVLSKDFAAQFLLGQLPFTAHDIYRGARVLSRGGLPTPEQVKSFVAPEEKPVEGKLYHPEPGSDEENAHLADVLAKAAQVQNDAAATPEQKADATATTIRKVLSPDLVKVTGWNDGSNRVYVDSVDHPNVQLPEHRTVFVDWNKAQNVQRDETGNVSFDIPIATVKPAKFGLETNRPKVDPNQPELPQQDAEGGHFVPALKDESSLTTSAPVEGNLLKDFPIEWGGEVYHGSNAEFDRPQALRGDVPFVSFTKDKATAGLYGDKVYATKVKPNKVWDYSNPDHVEALRKQLEKDSTLTDIYGDEAAETDVKSSEWLKQVKEGNPFAIEVARKQIRDLGFDSFTTLEDIQNGQVKRTEKALHLFDNEKVLAAHRLDAAVAAVPPEVKASLSTKANAPTVLRIGENLQKSSDPILDTFRGQINVDPNGKVVRLGNSYVSTEGLMDERRFQKTTHLPKEYVEAMKQTYPEAWKEGKVDVNTLVKGLKERPMVEVKKLGEGGGSEGQKALIAQHELETRGFRIRTDGFGRLDVDVPADRRPIGTSGFTYEGYLSDETIADFKLNPDEIALLQQAARASGEGAREFAARYDFLGPKSEKDMPGYVEILVRVPVSDRAKQVADPKEVRYVGPHFGSEDTNVLSFLRGYEENVARKKVFHVIEVQSDWGQKVREQEAENKKLGKIEDNVTYSERRLNEAPSHPLLSSYETLALKAAIDHARSIGADEIMLSDGVTAMMTEGHDKQTKSVYRMTSPTGEVRDLPLGEEHFKEVQGLEDKGWKGERVDDVPDAPQREGMRLHYDRTLPETLAKLTGEPGKRVELPGEHKQSREAIENEIVRGGLTHEAAQQEAQKRQQQNPSYRFTVDADPSVEDRFAVYKSLREVGSPVFRNPDGTPKSSITGRLFSLDKIKGGLETDESLSLKEAVVAYHNAEQKKAAAIRKAAASVDDPERVADINTPENKARIETLIKDGMRPSKALERVQQIIANKNLTSAELDQAVAVIIAKRVERRASFAGREQTQYAEHAVVDDTGKRVEGSRAEVEKHLVDNNLPVEDYSIRNNGRGKFYAVEKLTRKVSLDTEGALGGSLHEAIPEQSTQAVEDERNAERRDEFLSQGTSSELEQKIDQIPALVAAGRDNVAMIANELGLDVPTVFRLLKHAEERTLPTNRREVAQLAEVMNFVRDVDRERVRSAMTRAHGPGDTMRWGLFYGPEGAEKWMDWFTEEAKGTWSADVLSLMREFTGTKVKANNDPNQPFFYSPGLDFINIPYVPNDHEDALRLGRTIVHEYTHKITLSKMRDDSPESVEFVSQLKQVMDAVTVSKGVPPRIRRAIESMQKTGWLERWRKNEAGDTDESLINEYYKLVGNKTQAHDWLKPVYGLLDPEEFVSVVFDSSHLPKLMLDTPVKQTFAQNAMTWFASVWNRLFKGAPTQANAMSQFLTSFDRFMDGRTREGYDARAYAQDYLGSRLGVRPDVLEERTNAVMKLVSTGDLKDYSTAKVDWNADATTIGKAGMGLLREEVQPHREMLERLQEDLEGAKALQKTYLQSKNFDYLTESQRVWAEKLRESYVKGTTDYEALRKLQKTDINIHRVIADATEGKGVNVNQVSQKINTLRLSLDKQDRAIRRYDDLDNFDPIGWRERVRSVERPSPEPADPVPDLPTWQLLVGIRSPDEVREKTSREVLERSKTGALSKWLQKQFLLAQHFADVNPAHAARQDVLQTEKGNMQYRQQALNLARFFDMKSGKVDGELQHIYEKVSTTPRLNRIYSDIAMIVNEKQKLGQNPDWGDADIQQRVKKLTSRQDQEDVRKVFQTEVQRYKAWNGIWGKEYYDRIIPTDAATTIAVREGILPKPAEQIAQSFYDVLKQLQTTPNPALSEQLRALASQLSPATSAKVIEQINRALFDANDHLTKSAARLVYFNEQRTKRWQSLMRGADGQDIRVQADNPAELRKIVESKERAGAKHLYTVANEDQQLPSGGPNDLASFIEQLEAKRRARNTDAQDGVDANLKTEEVQGLAEEVRQAFAAAKPLPGTRRKLVEGRELLDMLSNTDEFYNRANNWMRHQLTRSRDTLMRTHPEVQGDIELKRFGDQMLTAFLTPDDPLARKITSATYFYKLGLDLGNNFIESFQHASTGMQAVIAQTGSVSDAFDLMKNASTAVWKHTFTKRWQNEDQAYFAQRLADTGEDQAALQNDIHDPDEWAMRRLATEKGTFSRSINAVGNFSRNWSGVFQRYGNRVTGLAAFELGRSQGMGLEEAFDFARNVKNVGMYTGGKAQRPGFYGSIKTRAVPQIMGTLQTYALGWFGQMYKDWKIGFSRNKPAGYTRTQIEGSKKAFIYGLAAQAALAGGLGLPGMGQGLALLQQATGLDIKTWLRQNLAGTFDEDQATGGLVSNVALNGILASVTPFDPSGRISVGLPMLPIDPNKGFTMDRLAGAPLSTVSDFVQGMAALASGDRQGWEKILPNALKRPARLMMDDGDVRDQRGGLLYQLSPAERVFTAIGLPPTRIQRAREFDAAAKNENDRAQRKQENLADELATIRRTQGDDALRARESELAQEMSPQDLVKLVQSAATRYQRQTIPFDWRRSVNPGAELAGLQTLRPSTVAMARSAEQDFLNAAGMRVRPNPRSDQRALLLDHLINTGVANSEADASRVLESTQGRHRSNVLNIPGLQ